MESEKAYFYLHERVFGLSAPLLNRAKNDFVSFQCGCASPLCQQKHQLHLLSTFVWSLIITNKKHGMYRAKLALRLCAHVLSTVQLHKKVDVGETRDNFQQSWNGCTSVSLLCSPKVQAWLIIISGVYSSGTQGHLLCSICCSDGQCNQLKNWGLSSSLGCLVPQGWDIISPNIISDPTQQIESPWNNLVAKPVNISDI